MSMGESCAVDDILLQSRGVPDLDRPVVRTCYEKVVIRRDDDSVDRTLVFGEMCDECSFGMPILQCMLTVGV
jgi:hypothetical protein